MANEFDEVEKKQRKENRKKMVNQILRVFKKKVILIAVIVLVTILLLSGFFYIEVKNVSNSVSEIAGSVSATGTSDIIGITEIKDRKIIINTEELNSRLDEWFETSNISKEQIGLSKDLSGLQKFLEAEIVTSFPDLRERNFIGQPWTQGNIQGCVKFRRRFNNGNQIYLEYMPYNDFQAELAKVGKTIEENNTIDQSYNTKEQIEAVYNNLRTKFTLDDEFNLIIVSQKFIQKEIVYNDFAKEEGMVDGDENEYVSDIEISKINYQAEIQKYTMPFEFCLDLLLITQNYTFVSEVADLAINSNIIIDVQDHTSTTTIVDKYEFDANFALHKMRVYEIEVAGETRTITDSSGKVITITDPPTYENIPVTYSTTMSLYQDDYKTTTTTYERDDLKLCITEAKTWLSDYTSDYANSEETQNNVVTAQLPDEGYFEVEDYHNLLPTFNPSGPAYATIISETESIEEKKTKQKVVTTTTTLVNKYTKSSEIIEDSPEKFLSLLKINPKLQQYDLEDRYQNTKLILYYDEVTKVRFSPENNLLVGREILYDLLASNIKTVDLEDTMRYLLDVYEGRIKVDKKQSQMQGIPGMFGPNSFFRIEGYWSALWNSDKPPFTLEEFVEWVKNYTPPNNSHDGRSYREYYIKHFVANAENYYNIATKYGLDPRFIFCIGIHESAYGTSNISYMKGNFWGWGAYDSSPYESALNFEGDASAGIEAVCKGIANNYVTGTWSSWIQSQGYDPTTIDGIGARYASDSKWASSVKRHMIEIFGASTTKAGGSLPEGTSEYIVAWANSLIGSSSFPNSSGGLTNSNGYCAGFVQSAYAQAGLSVIYGNAIDLPHPNAFTYTADGHIDYSQIPIGACIVASGPSRQYGHVAIYVGNGYVIEAGATKIAKNKIEESWGRNYLLGWGYCTNDILY